MDRITDSGSVGHGSIPCGCTNKKVILLLYPLKINNLAVYCKNDVLLLGHIWVTLVTKRPFKPHFYPYYLVAFCVFHDVECGYV